MSLNKPVTKLRKKYGEGIITFHMLGSHYYECREHDALTVNQLCGDDIERELGTDYCVVGKNRLNEIIEFLKINGRKVTVLKENK